MLVVTDNKIQLTRGDTATIKVELRDGNGDIYTPLMGDTIIFRLKKDLSMPGLVLEKEVDKATMTLTLNEEDTANLEFGGYYYELELVTKDNDHFTAITKTSMKITVELEDHG